MCIIKSNQGNSKPLFVFRKARSAATAAPSAHFAPLACSALRRRAASLSPSADFQTRFERGVSLVLVVVPRFYASLFLIAQMDTSFGPQSSSDLDDTIPEIKYAEVSGEIAFKSEK